MSETLLTVRLRDDHPTAKVMYVKIAENKWHVLYVDLASSEVIEGSCSDPIAQRFPIVFAPESSQERGI